MIPPNVIIPYLGTHASIPADYERDTRFDGKVVKGSLTSLASTGGSTTHNHGTLSHNHTLGNHNHSGRTQLAWRSSDNSTNSGLDIISFDHYHSYSGDGHIGGTTNNATITTTKNNLPEAYDVIFIKAKNYALLPTNGAVWSLNNRGTIHQGSKGRYLRGASTGASAGTTSGTSTHLHSLNHTHTPTNHTHKITTSVVLGDKEFNEFTSCDAVGRYHTHVQTLGSASQDLNSYSGNSSSETLDLYRQTLNLFSVSGVVEVGDISLTTETTNPIGWIDCDGTNGTPNTDGFYVKNTSAYASSTSPTGSNTHDHNSVSHSHTGATTHTHPDGGITNHVNDVRRSGNGTIMAVAGQEHSKGGFTCSSDKADYNSSTLTLSSANHEPPYIKAKYIMATVSALGSGSSFFLFEAC